MFSRAHGAVQSAAAGRRSALDRLSTRLQGSAQPSRAAPHPLTAGRRTKTALPDLTRRRPVTAPHREPFLDLLSSPRAPPDCAAVTRC